MSFKTGELYPQEKLIPATATLTKREIFAAMAMQGLLAVGRRAGNAREAVERADALIKELEKQ